jgi:basic membrane protein A
MRTTEEERKVKKIVKAVSLVLVSVLLLGLVAACGPAEEATPEPVEQPEGKELRVALVLIGPISDQSFNAMAYEGLTAIEEQLGLEVAFAESVPPAEFDETYRSFSDEGYDIIIGHGFEFGEPAAKIAPEYPDIYYLVNNGDVSGPNLASLEPVFEEAGFLVGALAGLMTESNRVGAVGGMEFPIIVRGIEAFGAGAKHVNPDVEATTAYIGTLDDVARGKEAGLAQISTGVDVIFHIANEAGVGVIEACKDEGAYAIGFGFDQNSLAPETVLTSFTVSYSALMVEGVKRILDGTFVGEIQKYGLEVGAVDISPYHGTVPDDVASEIEKVRQDIIDGNVDVPRIDVPPEK